jgi:hypothetical protein
VLLQCVTEGLVGVQVGHGTPKQDWEVPRLAGFVPVAAMAMGACVRRSSPQNLRASGGGRGTAM